MSGVQRFRRFQEQYNVRAEWRRIKPSNVLPHYHEGYSTPAAHPLHGSIDAALRHRMWSWQALPLTEEDQMHKRREINGTYDSWREEIMGAINGRRILITEDGGMGLAPAAACIGDHLCIIIGAPVPFVLRDVDGKSGLYSLVGSCYLNGLMSKDAIVKLEVSAARQGEIVSDRRRDFILV